MTNDPSGSRPPAEGREPADSARIDGHESPAGAPSDESQPAIGAPGEAQSGDSGPGDADRRGEGAPSAARRSADGGRKAVLLRLDPAVHAAIAHWASDDVRSVNAQIEVILRRALAEAGRLPAATRPIRRPGRPPSDRESR